MASGAVGVTAPTPVHPPRRRAPGLPLGAAALTILGATAGWWVSRQVRQAPTRPVAVVPFGHYANRARGARAKEKAQLEGAPAEVPEKRRCSPNWARLIAKVYHADPLVCRSCGGRLAIVAYITDEWAIRRILEHLGLDPPPQERPPPSRELVRVPVDEEGREIQAS